jgi:hypothetical protein
MNEYEIRNLNLQEYSLWINGLYVLATLLLAAIAIWGEKLRQLWFRPKLRLLLDEPTLTFHSDSPSRPKAWYYHLRVVNNRRTTPAINVRVLFQRMLKKGADDTWQEQRFTSPVQVKWRWSEYTPQFVTVGPDEYSSFAHIVQGENSLRLNLYWYPNNLTALIRAREITRLQFKAVSDITESNVLAIEVAWDGEWEQGSTEMAKHMIIKEVRV